MVKHHIDNEKKTPLPPFHGLEMIANTVAT